MEHGPSGKIAAWKNSISDISLEDARSAERNLIGLCDKIGNLNEQIEAMLRLQ